jgi:FtsP/CotA-like multicopper oxidase with cupredoxin domain
MVLESSSRLRFLRKEANSRSYVERASCAMIRSRKLIIAGFAMLLVILLVVLAAGPVLDSIGNSSGGVAPSVALTKSTCNRPPGFILIIADLSGFNDSIGHGAPAHPWPVVHVEKGQVVSFLVCNLDPTQAHGFAITYYFDAGVPILPGEAYRIVFTATEAGTFTIYCNIFCTIHIYMRGQLVVSA